MQSLVFGMIVSTHFSSSILDCNLNASTMQEACILRFRASSVTLRSFGYTSTWISEAFVKRATMPAKKRNLWSSVVFNTAHNSCNMVQVIKLFWLFSFCLPAKSPSSKAICQRSLTTKTCMLNFSATVQWTLPAV